MVETAQLMLSAQQAESLASDQWWELPSKAPTGLLLLANLPAPKDPAALNTAPQAGEQGFKS